MKQPPLYPIWPWYCWWLAELRRRFPNRKDRKQVMDEAPSDIQEAMLAVHQAAGIEWIELKKEKKDESPPSVS